ncbi:3-oxoacyl-ACP reductase [Frateuria aurantia]
MSDRYLRFVESGFGRWFSRKAGLPQPVSLLRAAAGEPKLPTLVGGAPDSPLRATLDRLLAGMHLPDAPYAPKIHALIYDASGLTSIEALSDLYQFFHTHVRRVAGNGRIIVVGTPPEQASDASARIAQRALEGFVRSVGKELKRGITAQLLYLDPADPAAVDSTLRFFLSYRSAYVSGQVVRIGPPPAPAPADLDYSQPLKGRRALVTGASRGIGKSIAQVLARQGADIVALDVPAAEQGLREIAHRTHGQYVALDITAADAGAQLLGHGPFDIVVHNAGITRDRTLAKMSETEWSSVMAVNLLAPQRLTDALLAGNGLKPQAAVVCVSSISGIAGNLGQSNYAASKAGVIGLVQSLAPRLVAIGGSINAVAPGFIETEMTAKIPLGIREAGRRLNSMSQGGLPVDVAETIAWLADPSSRGVNGQIVRVCGQSLLGA